METYQASETVYEVKVTRVSKSKKEKLTWEQFRLPYPDERTIMTEEDKKKDPQFGHARVIADDILREEVYSQTIHNLDMTALIIAVNKIGANEVFPHITGAAK